MNKYVRATQLWSIDKGLSTANPDKQFLKLIEELGEVAQEYTRGNKENLTMELGDLFVTVIILAQQMDIDPTVALKTAYKKISKRDGELIDGSFIKSEDLKEELE